MSEGQAEAIGVLAWEALEAVPEHAREPLRLVMVALMEYAKHKAASVAARGALHAAESAVDREEANAKSALASVELYMGKLNRALDPPAEHNNQGEDQDG